MPKIATYTNNVFPDAGPMADLAQASARNGYYMGQIIEQGWNALGRGVSKMQAGMEAKDAKAKEMAEQEDVANLTVAYAMKNAEMAVKWKKTVSETDPNNISEVQQKFMQDATTEYNMLHESAKTQKGRLYSMKARAEAFSSQYISTAADAMNLTGEAAVQSVNQIVDAYSKSAADDPGNVEAYHKQLDLALEAQIDGNNLDVKQALKLKNDAHAAIDKSAIEGMTLNNPKAALKALDDPKFTAHITGEEKVAYIKAANERIQAIASDEKAAKTEAENQAKQQAKNELIEIQKTVEVNPQTGKATVPKNFFTTVDQWAKKNEGHVDPEDVRAVKNYAQTKINTPDDAKSIGADTAVDPQTYNDFTRRAKNGTLTKAMIYDAAASGLLSDKHLTFFNKWIDSPEVENKDLAKFNTYLDGFKKIIVTSSMGIEDAAGTARYTDFNSDMMEKLPDLKAAGMNSKQIDEYVRQNVEHYQIKSADEDAMGDRADQLGVGASLPPNVEPLPIPETKKPLGDILGKGADASDRSIIGASRNPKMTADTMSVIKTLVPEAQPKFAQLVENLEARGVHIIAKEGRRSLERQTELYNQGRTTPGEIVTGTIKGSKHLQGLAMDIVPASVVDKPHWAPEDPVWDIVGEEVAKLGLKWGISARPGGKDKPHVEWVG